MHKTTKRLLWGTGVIVGLFIILILGGVTLFDLNSYKPQIEAAAAKALGMQLKINGKAVLSLSQGIGVSLKDVHLISRRSEILKAKEVKVNLQISPFVRHREWVIDRILLVNPKAYIEKNLQGKMNYETAATSSKNSGHPIQQKNEISIREFAIKNGEFTYLDQKTHQKFHFGGVDGNISDIASSPDAKANGSLIKEITFQGNLHAQSFKSNQVVATELKSDIQGDHGILHLNSTEMKVFGGVLHGNAQINFRGAAPKLQIAQTASQIDLSQIARIKKTPISGTADVSIDLAASGKDTDALTKTVQGSVSIRSKKITITGVDADALADQLKAAQGMDLLKLGSALVVGSLLPTLDQTAGITGHPTEQKTTLALISDWKLANGTATTKDVALSTERNTIVFKGSINLINQTYQNFYIATVDPKGCTKNKVKVIGALKKPRPSFGSINEQIGEEMIVSEMAGLFGLKKGRTPEKKAPDQCEQFYSGEALRAG